MWALATTWQTVESVLNLLAAPVVGMCGDLHNICELLERPRLVVPRIRPDSPVDMGGDNGLT